MATVQRSILDAVVGRLRESPALIARPTERIRVAHRTPVTREESPAIHVVPISDDEVGRGTGDCARRRVAFVVRIYGRDDGGVDSIDPILAAIVERINPAATSSFSYPTGAIVSPPGRITFSEEDADLDVAFAEIAFAASYPVAEWSLE